MHRYAGRSWIIHTSRVEHLLGKEKREAGSAAYFGAAGRLPSPSPEPDVLPFVGLAVVLPFVGFAVELTVVPLPLPLPLPLPPAVVPLLGVLVGDLVLLDVPPFSHIFVA